MLLILAFVLLMVTVALFRTLRAPLASGAAMRVRVAMPTVVEGRLSALPNLARGGDVPRYDMWLARRADYLARSVVARQYVGAIAAATVPSLDVREAMTVCAVFAAPSHCEPAAYVGDDQSYEVDRAWRTVRQNQAWSNDTTPFQRRGMAYRKPVAWRRALAMAPLTDVEATTMVENVMQRIACQNGGS